MSRPLRWVLIAAAVGVWLSLPALFPGNETVLVLLALYIPIVVGISLLAGYAGQVSLGQAAFFGIGAYGTGILTVEAGLSPWIAMPTAAAAAGMVAAIIGAPLFLLRGHYLVLATLGLNVVFEVLVRQLTPVTGGSSGLVGIPPLSIGGTTFLGNEFFFYAGSGLALVAMVLSARLTRSRVGRALQAIEGSETAAATLGISRRRETTKLFAWSAILAGASGALYAEWLQFLSPSTFSLDTSIVLLVMAVVGGIASVPGALVGVALVVSLQEGLREIAPSIAEVGASGAPAQYELIMFGLLLAAVVIFVPEGVWPRFTSKLRTRPRRQQRSPVKSEALASDVLPRDGEDRGTTVLEVEGLSRSFGGLKALEEVSFSVKQGELFAVIGPNGAGKTTLLNLLCGVVRPTAGRIAFDGDAVSGQPAHKIARLGVARSFQTPRLFGHLSVADNVKTGLHRHLHAGFTRSLFGFTRREERWAAERADAALTLARLGHAADERPDRLPFGALRLVELARSLASAPRVLLLDEPASGLSAGERNELKAVIERIREEGVAVVLVEHDVPLVMELADRVLVLHHGSPIAEGRPGEIAADQTVISAYLGESGESSHGKRRMPEAGGQAGLEEQGKAPHDKNGSSPLLRLKGVSASYGAARALDDIDIEVGGGEVVAVLGANGAGKTTLLLSVMGIIPAQGLREFDGTSIAGLAPERIVRRGLSLVPEGRELLPGMNVHDHLLLGAFTRRGRSGHSTLASDLADVYELFPVLAERGGQIAESLSGGEQQMLAIARALMSRPKLLLLDEPLLGLAPLVVDQMLASVSALADRGHSVVIVEQNAAKVLPIVDRAYVLQQGRVSITGTADELIANPSVQVAFMGQPVDLLPTEASVGNQRQPGVSRGAREERGVRT